jgi:hypothetical protein
MWRRIPASERPKMIHDAERFTGDAVLYGSWMTKVLDSWPISCEHNITDLSQNRRAWIGHAATCLAIGAPEDITRAAWGMLTRQQQDDANAMADRAISEWESRHGN